MGMCKGVTHGDAICKVACLPHGGNKVAEAKEGQKSREVQGTAASVRLLNVVDVFVSHCLIKRIRNDVPVLLNLSARPHWDGACPEPFDAANTFDSMYVGMVVQLTISKIQRVRGFTTRARYIIVFQCAGHFDPSVYWQNLGRILYEIVFNDAGRFPLSSYAKSLWIQVRVKFDGDTVANEMNRMVYDSMR